MLELFPEGFEEVEGPDGLELAAYTDSAGEERLWNAFGGAKGVDVEAGWEERWRSFHRPVRIGPLWVGPPWEQAPDDAIPVVVDPGQAFGTGSHATTRLCLELLVETERGSLLDVGCGSGVLAIAAAKLGYGPIEAVDADPNAVAATTENAAANGVELDVRLLDVLEEPLPEADVAVANITFAAAEQVAGRLRCRRLIVSGYLASQRPVVAGARLVRRLEEGGWAADLLALETG
jgi:ribosomal protein L11 methyltransferase